MLQTIFDSIHPSLDLTWRQDKREDSSEALRWARDQIDLGIIMSSILAIAQPDLYKLGRESLMRLGGRPRVRPYMKDWPFAFNVLSLIANRASPFHRDRRSGKPEYSDVLLSLGGDASTVLELPTVGIRCRYGPGSVAVFSGNLVLHGVSACKGERLCIAGYHRPALHHAVNVGATDWNTVQNIISLVNTTDTLPAEHP